MWSAGIVSSSVADRGHSIEWVPSHEGEEWEWHAC